MGWFGKSRQKPRKGPEKTVPPWAGGFDLPGYRAFLEALEDAVLARDLEATREGGVMAARLPDGQALQLGLQTLAQQCAGRPRAEWPARISAHLDAVLSGRDAAGALDRRDLDAVRPLLKVRLYPAAAVDRDPELRLVSFRPTTDLVAALAYDLPQAVTSVPPEDAARWARPEEELFALGLANLAGEPPLTADRIDLERGLHLDVLHGPSFFAAAQLLRMEALLRQRGADAAAEAAGSGPYGLLVAVPTRHLILYHPIADARVLMALNALIPQAFVHHQAGPGSLSTSVYWLRQGRIERLDTEVSREGVTFRPSPAFAREVMKPLGD